MGGAKSHDIEYRKEGISWWREELPNDLEYNNALNNLSKYNYSVDYIVTHCTGKNIINTMKLIYDDNRLTNFFDDLNSKVKFKKWFFGHYHDDISFGKYRLIYNDIINI